jgi:murein L,D-transpeptidase YafK
MKALIVLLMLSQMPLHAQFLAQQLRFDRVKKAHQKIGKSLTTQLEISGYSMDDLHLMIIAYKEEQRLDVYLKTKSGKQFNLWKSLPICASSGNSGPKYKQGDFQVPEGFYWIDRFNPSSLYHLSLGLNYPNDADRKRSNASDQGGDIFIHGKCVTIGCLPMTDQLIEPLYLLAVYARNNGQSKIPVYIFPFELSEERLAKEKQNLHYQFWKSLQVGYNRLIEQPQALKWKSDARGNYIFEP